MPLHLPGFGNHIYNMHIRTHTPTPTPTPPARTHAAYFTELSPRLNLCSWPSLDSLVSSFFLLRRAPRPFTRPDGSLSLRATWPPKAGEGTRRGRLHTNANSYIILALMPRRWLSLMIWAAGLSSVNDALLEWCQHVEASSLLCCANCSADPACVHMKIANSQKLFSMWWTFVRQEESSHQIGPVCHHAFVAFDANRPTDSVFHPEVGCQRPLMKAKSFSHIVLTVVPMSFEETCRLRR